MKILGMVEIKVLKTLGKTQNWMKVGRECSQSGDKDQDEGSKRSTKRIRWSIISIS